MIEGLTSKLVGKRLGISPRTVDVYRARLMRKTGAATAAELVTRLLAGAAPPQTEHRRPIPRDSRSPGADE